MDPIACATVVLDWDGTIIRGSSIASIASIRTARNTPSFRTLLHAWAEDMAGHDATYEGPRENLEHELAYQSSLVAVERRSVRRMEAMGLWEGVTGPTSTMDSMIDLNATCDARHSTRDVLTATPRQFQSPNFHRNDVEAHAIATAQSGQLELRTGVIAFLLRRLAAALPIYVLSTSWSASWIAAYLRASGIPALSYFQSPSQNETDHTAFVRVVANEIDPRGTGRLSRLAVHRNDQGVQTLALAFDPDNVDCSGIWTSLHKLQCLRVILGLRDKQGRASGPLLYCGDSLNDLHCLLAADVGICIVEKELSGEQLDLQQTVKRVGIVTTHVDNPQPENSETLSIYLAYVEDFDVLEHRWQRVLDPSSELRQNKRCIKELQ